MIYPMFSAPLKRSNATPITVLFGPIAGPPLLPPLIAAYVCVLVCMYVCACIKVM